MSDNKRAEDVEAGSKKSESTPSRRRFLAAAGSVGVASFVGIETVGATTTKKRVPKYISGDEVVQTMKVPQPWLAQEKKAREVLQALNRSEFEKAAVRESGLVRSERTFGGWNGFDVEIVVDETKPEPNLPDVASDVDVRVREEHPSERELQACKNINDYSNYKGGVNIFDDSPSETYRSLGTSGYRAVKHAPSI
jgi:hypothetical protein